MLLYLSQDEIKLIVEEIRSYSLNQALEEELEENKSISFKELLATNSAEYLIEEASKHENSVSSDLYDILPGNCHFESFGNRIKERRRLKEKILSYASKLDDNVMAAANLIYDVLRYTIILPFDNHFTYLDNYLNDLISMNYKVIRIKNRWQDDYCKGVSVVLLSPDGFPFEIQFHTQENYDMKEVYSREPYNISRDPKAPKDLVSKANLLRVYYHSMVKVPEGALEYEFRLPEKAL